MRAPFKRVISHQMRKRVFSRKDGTVYRNGEIYRSVVDKTTGNTIERRLIKTNHAKVMYDTSNLTIVEK